MNVPVERLPGAVPPKVGRYALCFEIAHGGMATVYLARAQGAEGFERVVALKCIHRHLASESEFVDMFLDEARIASSIHHPNVCSVFDYGKAEGTYYMAMEYLLGEPLTKLLRELGRLPHERSSETFLPMVARIVADACEGLHAAHEARSAAGEPLEIVHRDVSPQNLFLTYAGATKVVDFGIARARERVHQTTTGQVKGKFSYMSPEQLTNESIDRRTDVWAIGVVLWELVVGRSLFRRDTEPTTIDAVLRADIPPPSQRVPGVPEEIDAIVLQALARDPRRRYATAREMARDLGRFIARTGVAAGSPELSDWMQRLFPQGRYEKDSLLHTAMRMPTDAGVLAAIDSNPSMPVASLTQPLIEAPSVVRTRKPKTGPWIALGAVTVFATAVAAGYLAGARQSEVAAPSGEPVLGTTTTTRAPAPAAIGDDTGTEAAGAPSAEASNQSEAGASNPNEAEASNEAEAGSEVEPSAEDQPHPEPDDPAIAADGRRPRPRPRPAAASGPGTLVFVTPGGWANVYDAHGRLLGQTPLRVELPSGRHRLSLRPFGQPPAQERVVTIRAGRTARVTQPLSTP